MYHKTYSTQIFLLYYYINLSQRIIENYLKKLYNYTHYYILLELFWWKKNNIPTKTNFNYIQHNLFLYIDLYDFFLSIPFEKKIVPPPRLHDVAILCKILILSYIFDRETKITFLCEKVLKKMLEFLALLLGI